MPSNGSTRIFLPTHCDRAKWRLGPNDATEEDHHFGFEEGRASRIFVASIPT